jgi:dGTPase
LPQHEDRIWEETGDDFAGPYPTDRDRILYSSAFRRLAGVTQVVSPSEGHTFHNRLTHSLEVAQTARRLAEQLRDNFPDQSKALDNVNPDVAECAGLAHDLGHPPFGHVAEKELDRLVRDVGCLDDGYEGNAQAFRWITKLCVRQDWRKRYRNSTAIVFQRGDYGLNLTRATLNATLKYPWLWAPDDKRSRKWGAYDLEGSVLNWARELAQDIPGERPVQSVEAAIMDWADDITYSLHDTEDFYRAGLIPLDRLSKDPDERLLFLDNLCKRYANVRRPKSDADRSRLSVALDEFFGISNPILERYAGSPAQRISLRGFGTRKARELIMGTRLTDNPLEPLDIADNLLAQVEIAKEFVWDYVILNPSLATQQEGFCKIIRKLFETYLDASNRGPSSWKIIPLRFRQNLMDWRDEHGGSDLPRARMVRNVTDTIAAFTDNQAIAVYKRIAGISPGSLLDFLDS